MNDFPTTTLVCRKGIWFSFTSPQHHIYLSSLHRIITTIIASVCILEQTKCCLFQGREMNEAPSPHWSPSLTASFLLDTRFHSFTLHCSALIFSKPALPVRNKKEVHSFRQPAHHIHTHKHSHWTPQSLHSASTSPNEAPQLPVLPDHLSLPSHCG